MHNSRWTWRPAADEPAGGTLTRRLAASATVDRRLDVVSVRVRLVGRTRSRSCGRQAGGHASLIRGHVPEQGGAAPTMSVLPRRGLAIRGTVVMAALLLAGCTADSEPSDQPANPAPPDLPALPSVSAANPAEAEAIEEVLAVFQGFREVEARLYAAPPPPDIVRREFSPYLGDTMLSELVGTLNDMRNAGIVFQGRVASRPSVVDIQLEGAPPTATVRDCVDATGWQPIFQQTGDPVPGEGLPDHFAMDLDATLYPEHGWLFHDFAMEETQC
jgi:hypothetical protein